MRTRAWWSGAAVAAAAALLAACTAELSRGDERTRAAVRSAAPAGPTGATPSTGVAASSTVAAPIDRRPATTPCTKNPRARWVFVSLARQHMWLCARNHVVRDTAITSGMAGRNTETPTGNYRIEGLNRNTVLTLDTGATYPVKYWIPFDAPLFGFHDSAWQHFPYGSPRYKTGGSHGCVHVPLAEIQFLYRWADIGTPVTIRT